MVSVETMTAVAALESLARSYPWLDDVLDASARVKPTRAATARRTDPARAAAEHADRIGMGKLSGTTAAPLRLEVLDARAAAITTVDEAVWLAADNVRALAGPPRIPERWTLPAIPTPWSTPTGDHWTACVDYLRGALPHVDSKLAATLGKRLDQADRRIRAVTGTGADHRPVHAPCPACGRRGVLAAEIGSPDRTLWTVACTYARCRCDGLPCACGRPDRQPGQRHIWPSAVFGHLDDLLGRAA